MALDQKPYPFIGGLDVVSPALAVPPSRLISAMNYEPLAEGYGRFEGYERFDGRRAPSATNFWTIEFDTGVSAINSGVLIIGATSGANARVVLDPIGFIGSWGAGTGAGTLVLMPPSGTFIDGEILTVNSNPCATASSIAVEDSADTEALRMAWRSQAQEFQRALILKVPGSGPVRGVAELNGTIFAWRNNEAATACLMWRATNTGWQLVQFGHRLIFITGLVEIVPGVTIVGATSGASALVVRSVRQSGNWGSTAAGYLAITILSGTFTPGELLKVGLDTVATFSNNEAITIAPNGRFKTFNHNFYGGAATYRMYGCNGVDRGFEFDGTSYVPIATGTPDALDKPTRCFEIAHHLGFTFEGGSVQWASPGEPVNWSTTEGAGELGFGTTITDVVQATETAVAIFGQQKISMLTGTDAATFSLSELTEEAGSDPHTAQRVGTTMYLDRRGLRSLSATQAYGNFKTGTLSALIEPYFRAKRKAGHVPVDSLVCRAKSQYRLLWSDKTGLVVYMGRKTPEAMPFAFNNVQPFCAMTCELGDGTEGMFIGAEDGFVYRIDSGTSMDGVGVKGFCMSPFNHMGSARNDKRFHSVSIEMQAPPNARIALTAQFDYGDGANPIAGSQDFFVQGTGEGIDFRVMGGGGSWNQADWNSFYWSSPIEGTAYADLDGFGRNVSLIVACDSAPTEPAHVLQSYNIAYSRRAAVVGR